MSALSAERNTPRLGDGPIGTKLSFPVKASAKIYQGALVVLNAGYAAPGSTATSLIAVGVALENADNTGGADGAITVEVRCGAFKFDNSGGDAVVAADVGATVYITDDHTVNHTATGKSAAGKCLALDSTGVTVQVALY